MSATLLLVLKSAGTYAAIGLVGTALRKLGAVRVGTFLEHLAVNAPGVLRSIGVLS